MDPHSSPRLGRRARYESFHLPPHFPDPKYSPQRHPPFASFPPHPAAPTPPEMPRNQYYEPRILHTPGDLSYFPSPHRSNPSGFDPRDLPFPRVSDRAIHRGPPDGKHLPPEILERGRGGGGAVDKPGVFDEGPDRFQPYDNFFKLGYSDGALVSRKRLESENDRFLGDDSEWKSQRPVRFWDERQSRYHDPILEQLPPVAAPLVTAPPPFSSPRRLRGSGSVKNSVGEASRVFMHRHPPSSPRPFSDQKVVKNSGATAGNSQVFGNGPGPQRGQSIWKKKNNARDALPDGGFGGRQYTGHKSIKKSDPIKVSNEDGFWSSYHMVKKTSSISNMDNEHEFEEDSYTGYNPKKKMTSIKGAKYNANLAKRLVQKPSAFSRIQSGLSVWERLEEKPLILSPPPPSSLPCSLPSPRASNVAEAKASNLDLSFESKTQVANILDPSSAVPSSIEKDLFVENPNRVMKNKNMVQSREKVIFPIVSSSTGPSRNCNRVMKKKTIKKMIQTREKVVIPIVTSSPGSIAKQLALRNYNASSLGSVSVLPEAKKAEVSSCMPGGKSMPSALTTKGKKLAVDMKSGAEEAAKMSGQVDGCIIETPRMEDAMETAKYEGVINRTKQIGNFTRSGDTGTEPINDNHLQICQKIDMKLATPTNNVGANIISTDDNQAQDTVTGILGDSVEESLELSKKSDSICQRSLDFDVNVCSQPSEYIIDNLPAQDSIINRNENDAANSIKQIESVNSPHWEIGQDIPPPDDASPVLLGAGEVSVSPGSRTADTDTSPKSSNAEIEFEREPKHREKMVFVTDSEELEVPGNYASSQFCIHGLQAPSFSEVSNSAPELKLLGEGTAKEDNILSQSVCNMTFRDSLGTPTNDSYGEGMGQALLLEPMEMDPPAKVFENVSHSNPESSESMDFSNNAHSVIGNREHGCKGEAFVSFMASRTSEPGHESGKPIKNHQLIPEKPQLLPSHELKNQVPPNPKSTDKELSCKETSAVVHLPRFSSDRLKFSVSVKEAGRASQTGKHKTWLRTKTALRSDENTKLCGILSKQVPRKLGKIQNSSYFRKGNSLIRKLAPEPPSALLHTAGSSSTKVKSIAESSASEIRSECPDSVAPSNPLFERSKTPPLTLSKLSGLTMTSSKDFPQPIPMDRSPEPDTDQGNQHDSQSTALLVCDLESSQDSASFKTVEVVNAKKVTYVKRKTNQLVAAPGPEIGDSSKFLSEQFQKPVHHPIAKPKTMSFSSCLYHRSKRNQLIRNATSSDNKLTGILAVNTNSVDSLKQGNTLPYKKRLDNVRHKEKKAASSSLVWTLGGDKLSQKCIATLGYQRVFPYIFPWKRAINWMTFMTPNSIPNSSRSSVSLISRKLQCLRKRDTIYTVSTNGFSLRKAGVVSIGGSSLKWSKSIEKRSKKASEEATLAVAEVEREKREKGVKSTCGNGKNKVSLTCRSTSGIELKRGERIFRVGSARYKMDASMRTLLRIPDDSPSSASQQPGNSGRISFIPRRLIIGNNEYVRIGNGNQLVRDPKKLKRILANEKVRWSLHSARLRLAQKRQYCLFFTRFGKCNKRGRKCPYIHDPTKVAICTKFLKGQCSDTDCKLTHKVIPERMPDCSYFLKGLCTNLNCPYRHVKVNANAPLCDGFLRGHCADGDECRKKHSYACPLFEATGICPQGSLCKLHHRKNQSKSRKRKRTKIQSGGHGRYFYSSFGTAGEPLGVPSSQNDLEGSSDIFSSVGQFTEYINLDVDGDNVAIENDESDSGYHDLQSCDMDDLIKPVRIMNNDDDLTIF